MAVHRFGNVSLLLERDDHIPPLEVLIGELDKAKNIAKKVVLERKEVDHAVLLDLQRSFMAYLLDGDEAFLSSIAPPPQGDVQERAEVYYNGYYERLYLALQKDFPGLNALLGEDGFASFAFEYIAEYPSRYYSIAEVGSRLVDFLEHHPSMPTMPVCLKWHVWS